MNAGVGSIDAKFKQNLRFGPDRKVFARAILSSKSNLLLSSKII